MFLYMTTGCRETSPPCDAATTRLQSGGSVCFTSLVDTRPDVVFLKIPSRHVLNKQYSAQTKKKSSVTWLNIIKMSSTSTPSLNNSESMNMQIFLILTSCLYVLVLNKGEQSQTNKEKLSSFSRNRLLCLFLDKKVNVGKKNRLLVVQFHRLQAWITNQSNKLDPRDPTCLTACGVHLLENVHH